jgi:hypothetical protein
MPYAASRIIPPTNLHGTLMTALNVSFGSP